MKAIQQTPYRIAQRHNAIPLGTAQEAETRCDLNARREFGVGADSDADVIPVGLRALSRLALCNIRWYGDGSAS
jgi:hypothetical protein